MIKKLWMQLVIIYTAITGLILALCLGITFFSSCRRYEASMDAQIVDQLAAYQEKLLSTRQVDQDTWTELEEQLKGNVYLFENGAPLFRTGQAGKAPMDILEGLYTSVHTLPADELTRTANGWATRQEEQETASERFHAFYFRQDGDTQIEMLALQSQKVRLPFIRQQAVFYGTLLLLGCILLAAINCWLIRMVLKPVETSVRQQKEFIASAGHELKTPLASIRAGLDVLQKHVPASPEVSGVFYATRSEAVRMSHLIQDLLLLANSDRPNRRLELTAIEPDTFCLQLYEKYEIYARQQRHPLRLKIAEAAYPEIMANEEALTQIGSIFITNAISHTKENTPIEICCKLLKNGAVEIGVRDYGAGVAEQDLPRIFERFYRADPSRATNGHYGLGLSVAKSLAEQQSLQIGVRNAPEGGAEFYICTREQYKGKSTAKEW